eukprot:gene7557-7060_t
MPMAMIDNGGAASAPDAGVGHYNAHNAVQPMSLPGLGAAHTAAAREGGTGPSAGTQNAYVLNTQQINTDEVAAANANNATQLGTAVSGLHNATANIAAGLEHLGNHNVT